MSELSVLLLRALARARYLRSWLRWTSIALVVALAWIMAVVGVDLRQTWAAEGPKSSRGPITLTDPDSVVVFGPELFTHPGPDLIWSVFTDEFDVTETLGRRYVLEIGDADVSNARVSIGGQEFLGQNGPAGGAKRIIEVDDGANSFNLAIKGYTGSSVWIRIVHVPDATYEVYERTTFVRLTPPDTQTAIFNVDTANAAAVGMLHVINGAPGGSSRMINGKLWLNGQLVASGADFTAGKATVTKNVTLLANNTVKILNQSTAGTMIKPTFRAIDDTPPVLKVAWPADTLFTSADAVQVEGEVVDQTPGTVSVNGSDPYPVPGEFSHSLPLSADGKHLVIVEAANSALLTTVDTVIAVRDTREPTLTITDPPDEPIHSQTNETLAIAGWWRDSTFTTISIDGDTVAAGHGDTLDVIYPLDFGANRILFRAVDRLGNVTEFIRIVLRGDPDEDAREAALEGSALDPTGTTPFLDQVKFLYTDASPIQTGVITDSISANRAAVVRGRVLGRDLGPLRNVTVSVLDGPEFGSTLTRMDGSFDMVVNGGTSRTLRFSKPGYLGAQRLVDVPVLDYAIVDDLALVGKTARHSTVNLAEASAARGRFAHDSNGDRELRMLFPAGSLAQVVRAPNDITEFESVRVRATELTVGADGPLAMPALLPPGSAYTYCVDLRLDQADSMAEASGVPVETRFTKPVACYVRNFLHSPVGSHVPVGYYDERAGRWVPSNDGLVIAIVGVTDSGAAEIDTDGDGVAEEPETLESLEIDSAELTQLMTQYAVGDTVWRVMVDHFSVWDFNFNVQALMRALSRALGGTLKWLKLLASPCFSQGSIIECENRVLGERLGITGSPYTLNYRSFRAPGDLAIRSVRVPVLGDSVPPGLRRIVLTLDVAGKRFEVDHAVQTSDEDVVLTLAWDGLDAFGRTVQGSVVGRLTASYHYVPFLIEGGGGSSFGNPSSRGVFSTGGRGERDQPYVQSVRASVVLGAPSAASDGLGGWTLSPHHFFDQNGDGALYLGDGSVLLGDRLRPTISTYAGTQTCNSPFDEVSTSVASVLPALLKLGPDGSLYVADRCRGAILRIGKDRIVHRVAGTTSPGSFTGDGDALACPLQNLSGLDVGPDGTIYLSMTEPIGVNNIVAKVTPDGQIQKIIGGTYTSHGEGEGVPAADATVCQPEGVVLGPDGSLFFIDRGNGNDDNRVRRIATNGIVTTYAGNSTPASPDSGLAVEIGLGPLGDLIVDRDGNLYLAETEHHRIRKVAPDGVMTTLCTGGADFKPTSLALAPDGSIYATVGAGAQSGSTATHRVWRCDTNGDLQVIAGSGSDAQAGDGVPAGAAQIPDPTGIAIEPDGSYFVGSIRSIRRIGRTMSTRDVNELRVPSPDGLELFYFDATSGRHLRTLDAMTGALRHTFNYDALQRLMSIHDFNGDSTLIERDIDGRPTAIVAPYGQRTELDVNAYGWLSEVENPAGEVIALSTDSNGLLRSLADPKSNEYEFNYAEDGRLALDSDPSDGTQQLTLTFDNNHRKVEHRTGENRVTEYHVTELFDGTVRRLIVGPDQGQNYASDSTDARTYRVTQDGMTSVDSLVHEPRFGMTSPILRRTRSSLPSGITRVLEVTRPYSAQSFDPPEVTGGEWVQEVRVNERPPLRTEFTIHSTTCSLEVTSPEERVTRIAADLLQRPTTVFLPGLDPLSAAYDAHGRLERIVQGNRGARYTYDAEGRLEAIGDTLGRETSFGYDDADRITSQTLVDGAVVDFDYDDNGNLSAVTPPGGGLHGFEYTSVDLLERYVPPPGSGVPATEYTYNLDRQLTEVERAGEETIELDYDAAGRLETVAYPHGTNTLTYRTDGQLGTLTTPDAVTTTLGYDGPVLTSVQWTGSIPGGAARTVSRTLNREFRSATETVTGTDPVAYTYDDDGALTAAGALAVHRNASSGFIDSTHLATTGDALTTSADYDGAGDLRNLRYAYDGATQFSQSLTRDAIGRVTAIAEHAFGEDRTWGYRYDTAGRLYGVTLDGDTVATYRYDANGNRTIEHRVAESQTVTATYDSLDRMILRGSTVYEYRPTGDLARKIAGTDTTAFVYDALGNLQTVRFASGDSVTYAIDGTNRRVGRRWNDEWTDGWLYRNGLQVVAELDAAGAVVTRYVYGADGHVPSLVVRGDTTYRVITDHLGSVRGVVNVATGMVAEQRDYDAWGVLTARSGEFQSLGYAGGLEDTLTGLVRFGARDYEPVSGRWTAIDPIGFAGGSTNLMAYAYDDPVNLIDPSGLEANTRGLDCLQLLLDLGGVLDPTGTLDGVNALIYLMRGQYKLAAISALQMPPVIGNLGLAARGATEVGQGLGRAGKQGPPNSIYEQLDDAGSIRSRTFYDGNGHPFSRQDFDHPHGGLQPHETTRTFNAQGRPITPKVTGPLPPGYDNTPTVP